ncbi:DUF551 domain-containing protein [Klebsiella pneumoniae]
MTKSTITRERLEQLADNNTICKVSWDERIELAQIALAAMDSESGCLPLDYLQGHKDGLEWAAQLAEANHPETGDWLYDDPIELAKAIRKGPDMQPAQPVADSEPDRNPVLAYADSYRDMAKQGVESVPIWSVITDLERNIAPLYRHALPAPVVQCPFPCGWDNLNKLAIQDAELVARGLVEGELTTEAHRQAAISNNDRLLKVISSCRAAMLQAGNCRENANSSTNSPVIGIDPASGPDYSVEVRYVAPPGYVMVPKEPTPEILAVITEATRAMRGSAATYARVLEAAPQPQNAQQNIPEIIPGWIPVSERMPPSRHEVLVGRWWGEKPRWCCKWATYIPGHPDAQSSGWLIPGGSWTPTHWMELPAGPKEVK